MHIPEWELAKGADLPKHYNRISIMLPVNRVTFVRFQRSC
jgi:hypothetical protein